MKFSVTLVAAIAVPVFGTLLGTTSAAADDVVDLRDAVKRVREGLATAMGGLPANATTASQTDSRHKAAEKVRAEANTWRIRAEFTVTDIEFVRPDLTAINVKGGDLGANAATGRQVLAKIPVELGQSIRKGDRIRLTGPAVLSVSPLDNIHPNAASSEWGKKLTEVAYSADPRPGGGHNDQPPEAWPRWILSLSSPTVEVLGAESSAKQTEAATQDAPTLNASKKDVPSTSANPKRRDAIEIAREIGDALTEAHAKGTTTVAKNSAIQEAERKLVARVAVLESVTLALHVADVTLATPAGDRTRCRISIQGSELPSGTSYGHLTSVTLSNADAAIASAGPCTIRISGKPALYFPVLATHKKGKTDRPHGNTVLESALGSQDRWQLVLTEEVDKVEKGEK